MHADLRSILRLELPVIVRLGERLMPTREVLALLPGSIIEIPKHADEPLDLLVNNRQIGHGTAVKIGENFGIRITGIGGVRERIHAMGGADDEPAPDEPVQPDGGAEEIAAEAVTDAAPPEQP